MRAVRLLACQYQGWARCSTSIAFIFIFLTTASIGRYSHAANVLDIPDQLKTSVEAIRQGKYAQVISSATELQNQFADQPLSSLVVAEAYWGLIYCETAHITPREVWHVAQHGSSSYDKQFAESIQRALISSENMNRNGENAAVGALYKGLSHGIQARLFTFRGDRLKSATEGKKMRAELLEAVEEDSSLMPEASFGLGAYNYYADILSPMLKLVRFFLGIPAGDRSKGLEQLRTASQHSILVAVEAQYELAHIYSIQENYLIVSLAMLKELSDKYPSNALYALATAIQAGRSGQDSLGLEYASRAAETALATGGACGDRLSAIALQTEKHLNQKIKNSIGNLKK